MPEPEWDAEGEWVVRYLLKPDYVVEEWRGQAPSEAGAHLFARNALLVDGKNPKDVIHLSTKRAN